LPGNSGGNRPFCDQPYHNRRIGVIPLVSPFETSFGRIAARECILIRIYSEGLIGLGECVADRDPGYAYETSGTAWHILKDFIVPLVLDKNITSPFDFQNLVSGIRGHLMAKAGFEMAIWDLFGKATNKSLRILFNGTREKVDVGVSVGIQTSPQILTQVVNDYLAQGYGRIKIKIKPGRDIDDVGKIRAAFPDLRLQVDANSAYTLKTVQSLLKLDDYSLLMIEQPLYEDDLWENNSVPPFVWMKVSYQNVMRDMQLK
jgi:O-succinylbenzoate synthase